MLLPPTIGWIGATATLVVWHILSIFTLGLRSQTWHGIEEASFLGARLLFWRQVVEPSRNALQWPESSIFCIFFRLPCLAIFFRDFWPGLPRVFVFSMLLWPPLLQKTSNAPVASMWTCVTVAYLLAGG